MMTLPPVHAAAVQTAPAKSFRFLSVNPTGASVQLSWTALDGAPLYLLFAQEIYGVYSTKKNRFEFVGLEPGKTYNVFVLAVKRGPECIAHTAFDTRR